MAYDMLKGILSAKSGAARKAEQDIVFLSIRESSQLPIELWNNP
jgi:hypothetical protein